jgi:dTDP-glucose pyrophosphorylase
MVPVANRPFLEYLILQLKRQGLTDIVLCTGYLGEQVQKHFGGGSMWDVNISYSQEPEPLGTGGAIKLAEELIEDENFLVMNGDSFLDIDLNRLIDYHLERNALATMALVEIENPARYGAVEITERGEIESFVEKGQRSESKLINGGVYVLNRKIFEFISKGKISLEKEVFPKLIGKGFYGMPVRGFFTDIGVPADYKRLQENPQVLLRLSRDLSLSGGNDEAARECLLEASSALSILRKKVRWKPGKDIQHLEKRKAIGHLPERSSLEDYNTLITKLIKDDTNIVYLYEFGTERYYTVRGKVQGVDWIVIFGKDGITETAFPPRDVESYIENRGFRLLGKTGEVVRWERKKGC